MTKSRRYVYREYRTRKRSLAKSIIYRILIVTSDIAVLYLLTRNISLTASFTVISNAVTTIEYYFHERLWSRIGWGIEKIRTLEK